MAIDEKLYDSISVSFPKEDKEILIDLAKENSISVGCLIRKAISKAYNIDFLLPSDIKSLR